MVGWGGKGGEISGLCFLHCLVGIDGGWVDVVRAALREGRSVGMDGACLCGMLAGA